jgi:hypothetical protein
MPQISVPSQDEHNDTSPSFPNQSKRAKTPVKQLKKNISKYFGARKEVNVLTSIDKTPILLLRFTSKANPEFIRLVTERLIEANMALVTEEKDSDGNVMLGISITQKELELEAERLNLIKPFTLNGMNGTMSAFEGTEIMEQFQSNRKDFRFNGGEEKDNLSVYDESGVFTSADRVMIVNSLIESLSVLAPGVKSSLLARKLNEKLDYRNDEIDARYHQLYLLDTLRKEGYIDIVTPIHNKSLKNYLLAHVLDLKTSFPLEAVR